MQAYSTITIIALLAIVAHWGATKAPVFHHSYTTQRFKQADNAWLHQQCQKPEFYSHMRQHTTVCELARQAFALSPWMAGIQACFPSASNVAPAAAVWNRLLIGVVLGMCIMLSPTLLLPLWQRRNHRSQIEQLHRTMNNYAIQGNAKSV